MVKPAEPVNCIDCASQPSLPSARASLARLNVSSTRAETNAIVTSANVGADSYIHVNICISGTFPCSVVSEMQHIRGLLRLTASTSPSKSWGSRLSCGIRRMGSAHRLRPHETLDRTRCCNGVAARLRWIQPSASAEFVRYGTGMTELCTQVPR